MLASATIALDRAARDFGADSQAVRLEILEGVASRLGGWELSEFRTRVPGSNHLSVDQALAVAAALLPQIATSGVPPAFALCSLARPDLESHVQRTEGAFYTDFRLAAYLASTVASSLDPASLLVDPACGTGILLVAAVTAVCGDDRMARAQMLREAVCAADLSGTAIRGALLSLASLTEDLDAVSALSTRMRVQDSLIWGPAGWADVAPNGFRAVIGNPPWEKVKVTRHEFLRARGEERHYGGDYAADSTADAAIAAQREEAAEYALTLSEKYPLLGTGEADLYKAFVDLSLQLASPAGAVAMLVPAGLIRSQGTRHLREALFTRATSLDVTVFENRAKFFAIDTRFKFLTVTADLAGGRRSPLVLRHARGTPTRVEQFGRAAISRRQLTEVRADLSVPEVRSEEEWRLFQRMASGGERLGANDGVWQPTIVREVDMTRDRKRFLRGPGGGRLPLIEGRMVHHFRAGAKAYVSGTGRRAIWAPVPVGSSALEPQHWLAADNLPRSAVGRACLPRVGFCDITGQTNERTILAAHIPSGAVCGNKVPTITFDGPAGESPHAFDLFLAIANSFAFDWLARRVVTTTVNFFLLLGLPFPSIDLDGLPARRLAALVQDLVELDKTGIADPWKFAEKRAAIDVRVAQAYGLTAGELALVLDDFPLLDRGQPPIETESRSTVTRDLVLSTFGELIGEPAPVHASRTEEARRVGAAPYVPAQYSNSTAEEEALGS